jgi:protein-ribulosamine 3-kinase
MIVESILKDCGLSAARYTTIHGGDINQAFCIEHNGEKFFLKYNDAGLYPKMLMKESNGLKSLAAHFTLIVPEVIHVGVVANNQYLLTSWLDAGKPAKEHWQQFGEALAQLHRNSSTGFGWEEDNYIGSLAQLNTKYNTWSEFYARCRVEPLMRTLYNAGIIETGELHAADSFYKQLDSIFPAEPPALIHGDLWSGNFMFTASGKAAIFDPAVYYGHREMDIAMTLLFGGFDAGMYESYNASWPLQPGWRQRMKYAQLYPLLVHAVLFGGHYISQAMAILRRQ